MIVLVPGDRAHAAGRRALRRALRRHRRGAALQARRGRALRRVAAAAHRRGADLRRPALRRLRAARAPRRSSSSTRSTTRPTSTRATRATTRALVAERARRAGGLLVCGSATPRCESATALRRVRLPERVDGRPLPPVEVIDMRAAQRALHPRTHEALVDARKAIVLLNRRGWSNFLTCQTCGHALECPECDVDARPAPRRGRARLPPLRPPRAACPRRCAVVRRRVDRAPRRRDRAPRARTAGPAAGLPPRRRRRSTRGEVLARFRAADRGVLVGTQMVAKGHDFPDVELGVVLDADGTLRFPDFRAEERTFALVAQLAGRAGRGTNGRVLVQTIAPDAPRDPARRAPRRRHASLAEELRRREALQLPAVRDADPDRRCVRAAGARAHAAAAAIRVAASGPARWARRRCSGCAAASARRSSSRPRERARGDRARCARPSRPWRRDKAHRQRASAWTSTRNNIFAPMARGPGRGPRGRGGRAARRRWTRRSPSARRRRARARAPVRRPRAAHQGARRSRSSTTSCARRSRRMGALMHDALGIGLAATQVGILHRLLVYRVEPEAPGQRACQPGDRVVAATRRSGPRRAA